MKKWISLILCVLILLATLSGCGKETGGIGEIKVQPPNTLGTNEPPETDGLGDPGNTNSNSNNNGKTQDPSQPKESPKPKPSPKPSPSPLPEPPQDNTSQDSIRAAAYLNVIDRLIARYGEGEISTDNYFEDPCMTGLGVVRLIDFDGDGTYELYCAYSNDEASFVNKQAIYGYGDGLITLMEECNVSNPGTDVSPSTTFLSRFGKVFLVEVNEIVHGRYLTVQDGKMVSVLDYYYDFWDEGNSSVNGVPATEDEVMYAIAEMENGGDIERIDYYYPTDNSVIIKTQETIKQLMELAQ